MIYITSDLHFCHDKEFLFKTRGFNNIEDHNKIIVSNWNSKVKDEDEVYVLGDLMLKDNDTGIALVRQLKGKIHIILGNHDTSVRIELYKTLPNVVEIVYATQIKYKKLNFYLSHYPTLTGSGNLEKDLAKEWLINLHGHTHQSTNFYEDNYPFKYCVGLDSHNNQVVSLDQIIEDIKTKVKEITK